MKLFSDLHLEFGASPDLGHGDTLILAGDIVVYEYFKRPNSPKRAHFIRMLQQYCDNYELVIMVPGNHEYYNSGDLLAYTRYSELVRVAVLRDNLVLLNDNYINHNDVVIYGTTLWSDLRNPMDMLYAEGMNDYRASTYGHRKLRPSDTATLHVRSVEKLKHTLELLSDRKFIVVTHHAPSFASVHEMYRGDTMNCCYSSNLEYLMSDQILYWCHGHHHSVSDYMIGNTRVLCNPVGYPGEKRDFTTIEFG
jgi:DNA repair exonuclease SbcCD nuclease subunit